MKGAQFERVLDVIEDDDTGSRQDSYGKYSRYFPLSESGEAKDCWGEESALDFVLL